MTVLEKYFVLLPWGKKIQIYFKLEMCSNNLLYCSKDHSLIAQSCPPPKLVMQITLCGLIQFMYICLRICQRWF